MAKVSLASVDKAAVLPLPDGAIGRVEARAVFARPRDPLHLIWYRLARGSTLPLTDLAVDAFLHVLDGAIDVGDVHLDSGSSILIEAGASLHAVGVDGATLLLFTSNPENAEPQGGGHLHFLPSDKVHKLINAGGYGSNMTLYADAQSPVSTLWMHAIDYPGASAESLHSHSADEIIFVTAGTIRLGNRDCGPGTALAIAANTKYGFAYGPDGLSFLNFRAKTSVYRRADGSEEMDEPALWRSMLGQPRYLEPA